MCNHTAKTCLRMMLKCKKRKRNPEGLERELEREREREREREQDEGIMSLRIEGKSNRRPSIDYK